MLFHVTMKHKTDDCPAYHREKMSEVMKAFETLEARRNELNVTQHFFVWCPPNHIAYLLLEADTLDSISRYIFSIPFPHDSQVVPVEHLDETMTMAKSMAKQEQ